MNEKFTNALSHGEHPSGTIYLVDDINQIFNSVYKEAKIFLFI